MIAHSNGFKEQIKTLGRELSVKITTNEGVLDEENIISVKPYFNASLFSTVMKAVDFEVDVDLELYQYVKVEIGIKVDGSFEYLDYGNYYINDKEYNVDSESYSYKSYSKMIEAMVPYDLDVLFPITVKDFIIEIAEHLGWEHNLGSFANENTEIENDLWVGLDLTFRDVLDDVIVSTMANLDFKEDKLVIKYPTQTNDTIDDEFLNADNVNFNKLSGPINTLVLSRAENGDTINRQSNHIDELHEVIIKDNILLSSVQREDFIDEMFEAIEDFEYTSFEFETSGILYYEPLDMFNVEHGGKTYNCLALNNEINITDGIKETIYAEPIDVGEINYATSSLSDKGKKMANIIAYKNEARIEMVVNESEYLMSEVANVRDGLDGVSETQQEHGQEIEYLLDRQTEMQIDIDGVKVSQQYSGGYNLITNAHKQFGNDGWDGNFLNYSNTDIRNNSLSKSSLRFMNGVEKRTIGPLENGWYNYSFKFKKLIQNGIVWVRINEMTYGFENLSNNWDIFETTTYVSGNSLELEFMSEDDNSFDLVDHLLTPGRVRQIYTPSPNEVHTGTIKLGGAKLSIESSEANTIFEATTDGTRIKNKNTGQIITEYTEWGTRTNRLESGNSDIAKVSHLDVGEQTFIGRK